MNGGNRKPFDGGGGSDGKDNHEEGVGLCDKCKQIGAAPRALVSLMAENRENEKRLLGGQGACMRCHSGGLYGQILCTNTDCPIFYVRCETPRTFTKLVSSMNKL